MQALTRDYTVGPEIGRGRFGTVYRCTSASTGEHFALKSIDKSLIADPLDLSCVTSEPKLTSLASSATGPHHSTHIVSLRAVYEDPTSLHMVLDLCSGGDLLGLLKDRVPLPEPEAAAITASLMKAVACCHARGVAHRDIKPDNILFGGAGGGALKLEDFGSAECFGDGCKMTGLVGTAQYVAPEVVRGEEHGKGVDVWSAGVMLYAMLGGVLPFVGEDAGEVFEAVVRGNLRFPTRVFGQVSREAKDLMRKMMCRDPERRPSAEQVLRHPWMTNGGGGGVRSGE